MNRRARRLWIAPLVLVTAACATAPPSPRGSAEPPHASPSREARRLVVHAEELAARGQARAAVAVYERVLREHAGDPAAASALYRLGLLQVDPSGGVRNYQAAQRTFSRLLADYPGSRWQAEARAWREVLTELIARETETAGLKAQIERLRRTDLDLERRR